MANISGTTRVTGLFGLPVEHSLSPALHNAAYNALDMDYRYLPFPVQVGEVETAVKSIRSLGMAGVNVTAPHKQAVMPFLDQVSPEAEFLQAVNTIVHREGELVGHNTDAQGYLAGLEYSMSPAEVSTGTALILGGGGAARAAAAGLAQGQRTSFIFALRSPEKMSPWLESFKEMYPGIDADAVALAGKDFKALLPEVTLLINTFPGMEGENRQEWFLEVLALARPHTFFSDLRYAPPMTPFLSMGKSLGCRCQNGLPMLLEQAVLSFALFTGEEAHREVMAEAINL